MLPAYFFRERTCSMTTIGFISLGIFVVTYALMLAYQNYRPYFAIGAAVLFLALGMVPPLNFSYSLGTAFGKIDWNVLMMIAGTMGTVHLFIESKMPGRMADMIIGRVHTVQWLIVALSLFAGIVSAFVDNVATVLMIAPVALAMCKKLNISPVPALICIAVSSNLQGAATLVGDTTSILLAKEAGLDFLDFFRDSGRIGMFFVVQAGAILSGAVIWFVFRKDKQQIHPQGLTPVSDKVPGMLLLLTVITLILVSFIPYKADAAPGAFYKPDVTNGLICVIYFMVGVVFEIRRTGNRNVLRESLKEIDFFTLALLTGLFIVIGAIDEAGVIHHIGTLISGLGGDGSRGSVFLIYSIIVWMSVILSAFIDNIPYTLTMLPVVTAVAASLNASGAGVDPKLFYYGLLCGATLGGNLTPIGASANIAGIGILRKDGWEVKTGTFMRYSVPFTLVAVTSGYILLWFIWAP